MLSIASCTPKVSEWACEGGAPPELLAPASMHSLLELSRLQRVHEVCCCSSTSLLIHSDPF